MPFRPFRDILPGVEKAEIKRIAEYLKDLEEGLYEWDYRGITTQGHLTELYRIIKTQIDGTIDAHGGWPIK